MSGDVKDQGVEGGSLTAADLDRLAYEWSERRVVMNGIEFAEKADRARLERLKTALPSLLALARRGLEADKAELSDLDMNVLHGLVDDFEDAVRDRERAVAIPAHDRAKAHQEATRTALMRALVRAAAAPDAESKLAAALAEVERVRGRLERVTPIVARAEEMLDGQERLNRTLGIRDGHHDEHDMCALVRVMRAAEAHSARPAAPKGGPG